MSTSGSSRAPVLRSTNTGAIATSAWLASRGLTSQDPSWFAEITLTEVSDATTSLRIELFAEEWGYLFEHRGKRSWIRVTDMRFVHGHDEFQLHRVTPVLERLGELVRHLEAKESLTFDRGGVSIRTNLVGADDAIREWVAAM